MTCLLSLSFDKSAINMKHRSVTLWEADFGEGDLLHASPRGKPSAHTSLSSFNSAGSKGVRHEDSPSSLVLCINAAKPTKA